VKLPPDIDLTFVNNRTCTYTDTLEMLEDMRRHRRKSGWTCYPVGVVEAKIFKFSLELSHEDPDKDLFSYFTIPVKTVHRSLWPSLYPKEPNVEQLRRWFFTERGGLHKIAALINEVVKEPEPVPEEASAWNRLMGDDDLDGI